MPRKDQKSPLGQVEQEILNALQRLVDGKPNHPDMIRKAKRKQLKINISNVAKEAHHSRTLISHDGCAYPRARAAVLSYSEPVAEPTSMAEVNRSLRIAIAELKNSLKIAHERQAATIRRMNRLSDDANREVSAAQRREERGTRNPNEIAGEKLLRKIDQPRVIEFAPKKKTSDG